MKFPPVYEYRNYAETYSNSVLQLKIPVGGGKQKQFPFSSAIPSSVICYFIQYDLPALKEQPRLVLMDYLHATLIAFQSQWSHKQKNKKNILTKFNNNLEPVLTTSHNNELEKVIQCSNQIKVPDNDLIKLNMLKHQLIVYQHKLNLQGCP